MVLAKSSAQYKFLQVLVNFVNFARTSLGVIAAQGINMCGNLGPTGNPCYISTDAWNAGSYLGSVVELAVTVELASTPLGWEEVALGTANIACGVAAVAYPYYEHDIVCCAKACFTASCQTSVQGCFQGSGIC